MKLVSIIVVAAVLALAGTALLAQSGSDLFARALVQEKTGSYDEAIALYQTIVDKHWSDKKLAARALFQMGQAYEKLDKPDDARRAYERIARELSDQREIGADAQRRLANLNGARPADSTQRRICSDCGDFPMNSLSADGRLLAFDRDGDLFVRDNASGRVTALLIDPSDATRFPLLSPDGQKIAYVRLWNPDGHDLRIVDNQPGAKPRIVNDNPAHYRIIPAAWEPNGKSILALIDRQVDHTWILARVSLSDGTVEPLKSLGWRVGAFEPGLPRLSPDGRRVAYAARLSDRPPNSPQPTADAPVFDDSHIYVLSLDGLMLQTEVVNGASQNEAPVWTPDGRHLVFVSNRGGDWGVWSVDLASGALQEVSAIAGRVEPLGMTRSGSYVYRRPSTRRADASFSVSALNPTSGASGLRELETILGRGATWSPDSRLIAFLRETEVRSLGQTVRTTSLVVHSVDTKDEQRYVVPGVGAGRENLRWLSDSSGLLVWRGPGIANEVYRVDLKTKHITSLPAADRPGDLQAQAPIPEQGLHSPDGRHVITFSRDPVTPRRFWDLWAADNLLPLLSRTQR